jgi:hypothetical protein
MAESKRGRPYVKISGSGGYCEIDVLFVTPRLANTAHSSRVALMGQVSSDEEGPMEGVLVAAKKDGSRSSISIFSDYKSHYSFPSSKLAPGHYGNSRRCDQQGGIMREIPRDATFLGSP